VEQQGGQMLQWKNPGLISQKPDLVPFLLEFFLPPLSFDWFVCKIRSWLR
jgi:hypothetical protein